MTTRPPAPLDYARIFVVVPKGPRHQFLPVWGRGEELRDLLQHMARVLPPGSWTSIAIVWGGSIIALATRNAGEIVLAWRTRE